MSDALKFLLIGLGAGSLYAILAIGVTLVYRGSGIVNFAQGAFALVGAGFFYETKGSLGAGGAIVGAAVMGAFAGVLTQLMIMRPMRRASPLARVIATLGVMVAIQQGAVLRYGADVKFVDSVLPSDAVSILGTTVGEDRLWILGITVVLTAGLWFFYRTTAFGLATTGVAENEFAMVTLGWSPNLVAACNWAAGGALAGFAGTLLVPILGLAPGTLTLTVVPALAAALIGGFRSFPLTLAGGLLIGVLEAEATNIQAHHSEMFGVISTNGLASSVPFLVIIAILVIRGQALPLRSHLLERLPRLGTGVSRPRFVAVVVLLVFGSMWLFTESWVNALITSGIGGLVALSLVVVTGYAGQISLAQAALAGIGALIASRMGDAWGVPFPVALVAGVVLTIPIGMVVAIPALRTRGVNLAVATLGMSVVISAAVISNSSYTGGFVRGTVLPTPTIFGWSVDSVAHPMRYAGVVLVLFLAAGVLVANLRRGPAGRRLIAVRSNERAAASLGVDVVGAKLYAFAFGAFLAALAGVLTAFRFQHVSFDGFDVFQSINALLLAMIGGIGFVSGAAIAGIGAVGGVAQQVISQFWAVEGWFLLITALLFLVTIVIHPDGVAKDQARVARRLAKVVRRGAVSVRAPVVDTRGDLATRSRIRRVVPRRLEVSNLTVRFGGVTAVDGLSLHIEPGEVLGLIGPNGAGKTTVVDAITGFVRRYEGQVSIGARPIDALNAGRRSRAGLTRSFQSLELFDDVTVGDNLLTACEDRGTRVYLSGLLRPARAGFTDIAHAAIDEFDLNFVLDRLPTELPYAQRRAVAIARAVATSPSVLLLDEPAAGLDERSTRELATLVRRLADDWGMAVLLIEHDVSMVLGTCDRVMAINFGAELATGTPAEIRRHPAVVASYLGYDAQSPAPRPRFDVPVAP
jgi:sulfate-transporting ATPase